MTESINGYVHYLDSGDGFTGIYMTKFTKRYTLDTESLLCVNYFPTYETNTTVEKRKGV